MRHESWLHSSCFPRESQKTIKDLPFESNLFSEKIYKSLHTLKDSASWAFTPHPQRGKTTNLCTVSECPYTNVLPSVPLQIGIQTTEGTKIQICSFLHLYCCCPNLLITQGFLLMEHLRTTYQFCCYANHLAHFTHTCRAIMTDKWVLEIIHSCYTVEFLCPTHHKPLSNLFLSPKKL